MSARWIFWLAAGLLLGGSPSTPVRAQNVVEIYQRQRLQQKADLLARRLIVARPPDLLPSSADALGRRRPDDELGSTSEEPPPPRINRLQRIPKLGRSWFEKRFSHEHWTFLGSSRISPIDTMMTREIRSRMEAQFGKPTRALADLDARSGVATGDIFQFEYWFVVNDTIPVTITDVNGPFERGVAASTIEPFGEVLMDLRNELLQVVVSDNRRAAYVDYYFDDELQQWYRTGYDGSDYFLESIRQPGMNRPIISVSVPAKDPDEHTDRNVESDFP